MEKQFSNGIKPYMRWVHDKFENKVGNQNLGLSMFLVSYITTILYIIYEY